MSFLARLFQTQPDPRDQVRPLWHRTVEIAREPQWYADCGVADTLEGRFDMVCSVLALVLIRMEQDEELGKRTGLLTEFFVEDMDGQMRQTGVGDLMVGKKIGKLMSTLGGRIGAYRDGLTEGPYELAQAVRRNIELIEGADEGAVAARLMELQNRLANTHNEELLAGQIP